MKVVSWNRLSLVIGLLMNFNLLEVGGLLFLYLARSHWPQVRGTFQAKQRVETPQHRLDKKLLA